MKIITLLLSMLIISTLNISAQNLIAVQNGGTAAFYTSLTTAVTNAVDGDTIYLPGGSYSGNSISINKRIHIVGVGHHPDSTLSTAITHIQGINLYTGADGGSITGVKMINSIYFNTNMDGYVITRCNFPGINWPTSVVPTIKNVVFLENFITSGFTMSSNFGGFSICNNVISGQPKFLYQSQIKNNIFLYWNPNVSSIYSLYATDCLIENNIVRGSSLGACFNNCIFRNNLGCGINGTDSQGNQGSENFDYSNGGALDINTIFVSFNQATMMVGSSIYLANFHLPSDSPYKNGGRDGTDIGIYGGAFPWEEGSIPFNPHFQSARISPTTDSEGNLNVQIKVAAQDN